MSSHIHTQLMAPLSLTQAVMNCAVVSERALLCGQLLISECSKHLNSSKRWKEFTWSEVKLLWALTPSWTEDERSHLKKLHIPMLSCSHFTDRNKDGPALLWQPVSAIQGWNRLVVLFCWPFINSFATYVPLMGIFLKWCCFDVFVETELQPWKKLMIISCLMDLI